MRNTIVAIALVALILGFIGGFTVARQRYKPLLQANSDAIIQKDAEINKLNAQAMEVEKAKTADTSTTYMIKEGKMMVEKEGLTDAVSKDVTLADGTKVMVNGTVMKKDGTKIKLSEGESFGVK